MDVWFSALLAALTPVVAATDSVDASLESYASPQRLVEIAPGRKVHLFCLGSGSPTVVITAGLAHWTLQWRKVQPKVAEFTRVCSWDRPGHGLSDAYPEPLTVAATTGAMEAALKKAAIAGPYILVGHSIGSFETQLYAFRNPRLVSGIVLLDPSAPYQDQRLQKVTPELSKLRESEFRAWFKQMETCAATGAGCQEVPTDFGSQLSATIRRTRNVAAFRNVQSFERDAFSKGSDLLLSERRSLGTIPVLVLSAVEDQTAPPGLEHELPAEREEWRKMHEEIARLSEKGQRREVEAPHNIQLAKPEVVVATIKEVVTLVRSGRR